MSIGFPPNSYPFQVVADGAVAYWRLGEISGTTAVDVIGGYNGTITGGVTLNQPGAVAGGNPAMKFDGINGVITVPAAVLNCGVAAQSFTIECWLNSAYNEANAGVFKKGLAPFNAGGVGWEFRHQLGTNWQFARTGNGPLIGYIDATTGIPKPNVWSHIVVAYDASSHVVTAYVNAAVMQMATLSGNDIIAYTDTYPLLIGQGNDGYSAATFDEVAIYPTALSAGQIANHYSLRTFIPPYQSVINTGVVLSLTQYQIYTIQKGLHVTSNKSVEVSSDGINFSSLANAQTIGARVSAQFIRTVNSGCVLSVKK